MQRKRLDNRLHDRHIRQQQHQQNKRNGKASVARQRIRSRSKHAKRRQTKPPNEIEDKRGNQTACNKGAWYCLGRSRLTRSAAGLILRQRQNCAGYDRQNSQNQRTHNDRQGAHGKEQHKRDDIRGVEAPAHLARGKRRPKLAPQAKQQCVAQRKQDRSKKEQGRGRQGCVCWQIRGSRHAQRARAAEKRRRYPTLAT